MEYHTEQPPTPEPSRIDAFINTEIIAAKVGQRPEVSLEQRQTLQDLDKLSVDNIAVRYEAVDVVGVYAGVKPSAIVGDYPGLATIVERLGLTHTILHKQKLMVLARTQELVDLLADTLVGQQYHEIDNDAAHRAIGKLLGYPATSTEYFLERLDYINLPPEQQKPMIRPEMLEGQALREFSHFIKSPDHWRDEITAYAIPLEAVTREFAPRTYNLFEQKAKRVRLEHKIRQDSGKQALLATQLAGNGRIAEKFVR